MQPVAVQQNLYLALYLVTLSIVELNLLLPHFRGTLPSRSLWKYSPRRPCIMRRSRRQPKLRNWKVRKCRMLLWLIQSPMLRFKPRRSKTRARYCWMSRSQSVQTRKLRIWPCAGCMPGNDGMLLEDWQGFNSFLLQVRFIWIRQ